MFGGSPERSHKHALETGKGTENDADIILNKAIEAGDRGKSLSPEERAILKAHYPHIFSEDGTFTSRKSNTPPSERPHQ